jgi:hypothetical protein
MEAARTSETSVDIYLTTRQYILEDSKLRTRRRENLKSHVWKHRSIDWCCKEHMGRGSAVLKWNVIFVRGGVFIRDRNALSRTQISV